MRKIFWLVCALAMFPLMAWALLDQKAGIVPYILVCLVIFLILASITRPQDLHEDDDAEFLRFPLRWAAKFPDFWNEIKVGLGAVTIVTAIYWSTFVDWNKWSSAVAQVAIVGIVTSSLAWVGFSSRLETYKHKRVLFWAVWIAASLVLYFLISPSFKWLLVLPFAYTLFGDWEKENEQINISHRTTSH